MLDDKSNLQNKTQRLWLISYKNTEVTQHSCLHTGGKAQTRPNSLGTQGGTQAQRVASFVSVRFSVFCTKRYEANLAKSSFANCMRGRRVMTISFSGPALLDHPPPTQLFHLGNLSCGSPHGHRRASCCSGRRASRTPDPWVSREALRMTVLGCGLPFPDLTHTFTLAPHP